MGCLTQLSLTQACDTLLATLAPRPADDIAMIMARTLTPGPAQTGRTDTRHPHLSG